MKAFLKKGEQWAEDNKVPKERLLEAKLAEDMKVLLHGEHSSAALDEY